MNNTSLAILVSLSNDTLTANIADRRADAVSIFNPLPEPHRNALAGDAWIIGLRAVMNAHRLAEESRLEDIGKSILEDVDAELKNYVESQQTALLQTLKRYFDPSDGQFVTRIDAFLKDGGELSRAMEKFLGPEHGVLATTLAKSLGESSPLLKKLSPTDSQGVVALVEVRVKQALEDNRIAVAKALDPLAPEGAVARFLKSLKNDLQKADGEREKQFALATKALDANDKNSLLNRLVRETESARRAMVEVMNPEVPGSPLALLKTSLTTMLELLDDDYTSPPHCFARIVTEQGRCLMESATERTRRPRWRRRSAERRVRSSYARSESGTDKQRAATRLASLTSSSRSPGIIASTRFA